VVIILTVWMRQSKKWFIVAFVIHWSQSNLIWDLSLNGKSLPSAMVKGFNLIGQSVDSLSLSQRIDWFCWRTRWAVWRNRTAATWSSEIFCWSTSRGSECELTDNWIIWEGGYCLPLFMFFTSLIR
jgi:hypothetical protein